SVSFWHTAAPNSGNEYGWIGRTASAIDPAGTRGNMIVNISDSETLAVKSANHVPLVFIDPARFQRGVFAQEKPVLDALGAQHQRQLEYCADAVAGFFHEMQRIGRADDVVMYIHSEFGRRVPENTSLGTDHGTAQVNFVVGNAVKGGLYGKPPSLTNLNRRL